MALHGYAREESAAVSETHTHTRSSTKTDMYIYIYIFIYISFLGGYLVHQISHWQLSAFNVFRSQKQSLV